MQFENGGTWQKAAPWRLSLNMELSLEKAHCFRAASALQLVAESKNTWQREVGLR